MSFNQSKQRFCAPVHEEEVVSEKEYLECKPATQCRKVKEVKTVGEYECKEQCKETEVEPCEKKEPCDKKKRRGGMGVLWWLVISFVIAIILWVTRPPLVTNYDTVEDEPVINWWALVITSLIFGAIILGIIWLIVYLVKWRK